MDWITTGWGGIFLKYISLLNKILLISFLLFTQISIAQSYLRGEVQDDQGRPLPNARILLHSSGYVYYSGNSGSFGILTPGNTDSVTVSLTGYQSVSMRVKASEYLTVNLKILHSVAVPKNRLLSLTTDLQLNDRSHWLASGESYSSLIENVFVDASKYPQTSFAIRIDKASYSNVRRFLNMGTRVPSDAVRIEELMNYFNFGYTAPPADSVFAFRSYLSDCPWNRDTRLLFLQVFARKLDSAEIPASNLVFLVDVSGSMDMPNRLPLLKSAFKLLVDNLRAKDTVSIVVYGSTVGVMLVPTSGEEKNKIRKAIEDLHPGGSTPGESGILSAYRLAKNQFIEGGNNRVILATDGDFNVGHHTEEQLEQLIASHKDLGIYLTCLGVGMGNYKDSKLEVLAKKGNGNFSYLDNEGEAEKVLVKELTQTLYSVADDASLTINFDDRYVKDYRLIGFDNKRKTISDSITEVEGGEVGSGHSMTVLFEIVPQQITSSDRAGAQDSMASVQVRYRMPSDTVVRVSDFSVPWDYEELSLQPACIRFASSVAMFGSLLKESVYTRKTRWDEIVRQAIESYDRSDPVQEEFIAIIEKAKKVYSKRKKRGF